MTRVGLGTCARTVVIAAAGAARSGTASVSDRSVAYKLAAIDCKCAPNTARLRPYAEVLAVLAVKKCRESKSRLGDMAVVSTQLLAKKHIRMSTLQVLRGVNGSIPSSLGRTKCSDIFAAFVILVENP